MNRYYQNFINYSNIVEKHKYSSLDEIVEILKNNQPENKIAKEKEAIVLLGYSGNGKSTWINDLKNKNSESIIVSMDEASRTIMRLSEGKAYNPYETVALFGKKLDEACQSGKTIIIDGNFLNLFTRLILVDTLHSYGYSVKGIDILDIFDEIIKLRIMDFAGKDIGVKITSDNVSNYENNPIYLARKKHIMDYHEKEKESSFIEEQQQLGLVDLRLDEYIKVKSKDVKIVKSSFKQ